MKKILYSIVVCGLFFSCTTEEEKLKLESFEEKLAFTLGASNAKELIENDNFEATRLDKLELIKGFKMNYSTLEPDCGKSIEGLLGSTGTDFDESFLAEGSTCIGRYMSFSLFSKLDGFKKASGIDTAMLYLGFEEGLYGRDTLLLSSADQKVVDDEFSEGIQSIMEEEMERQWGAMRKDGEDFLLQNRSKDGVITTASGLQYEVIKKGTGVSPTTSDEVTVHYHGTLIDGTVFDSSIDRGETISFPVLGVIKGWTEVLQLMSRGAEFRVYVPQELAYGAYPQPGGVIKPYSMLIFDIQLINF